MRKIVNTIAIAALATALSLTAHADPKQLKFGNAGIQQALYVPMAEQPFADAVTKDSDGTLDVKLFLGPTIADNNNVIDRLKDGVIEIGTGLVGLYPALFPRTTVAMLPFESSNSNEAGIALMRLYQSGILDAEFHDYKVLELGLYANMSVHSKKPVTSLDDIKGMKVAVMSKTMAQVIEQFGGAPISMPPNDFYASLQHGVVNAAGIGWPGMPPFKLQEVVQYHLQASLTGEGNFTLMKKSTYEALPEKARAAIDKNGGMPFSMLWAKATKAMDDQGIGMVKAANQTITTLPPAEEAHWKDRAKPVVDAWVAATPDGAKVLAAYRTEIANIRAGK
jgi:TRAP-type transport system periplasmic protein